MSSQESIVIAMIFEYWLAPHAGGPESDYAQAAVHLRKMLDEFPGFRGVERFESCEEPGKFLALGFFDDEEAVSAWRNHPDHRVAQRLGRTDWFVGYRLRMAAVRRDYGPDRRAQAPSDRPDE